MNVQILGDSWDKLSGRHHELIQVFYERFLSTYPEYRQYFPPEMDRQMEKMVETIALVARVADETEIMHPQLQKIGAKHQMYQLSKEDLARFGQVFIDVLAEFCAEDWSSECQQSWKTAFDEHVIPYMMQGVSAT